MIKGLIQEGGIIIVNVCAPNTGAPQCIRQTLTNIKGDTDSNTVTVGDFNTPLTPMGRSSKQKINKETQVLNDTLDEMDLVDIFRTFHILGHKSSLIAFKKIEIISNIFSDHNAMSLDINYKKKV